jgi:hypothetical protein
MATTAETIDILISLDEVKASLTTLSSEVHLYGEILTGIVQLLTPSDEQSGPRLHELLAALIGRLDRQAVMLNEILEAQRNLRRTLPVELAQAIDNSNESGGTARNGTAGSKPNGGHGKAVSRP